MRVKKELQEQLARAQTYTLLFNHPDFRALIHEQMAMYLPHTVTED